MNVQILPVTGYSKQAALDSIKSFKSDVVAGANATQAWIDAGSPLYGTAAFKHFCVEQLVMKTKCKAGLGCYITVENAVEDSRRFPHKLLNLKSKSYKDRYHYKQMYQIFEAILNTSEFLDFSYSQANFFKDYDGLGKYVDSFPTLEEAKAAAAELTDTNQKHYIIQKVKMSEDPLWAISLYTPSKGTKMGTYIAFGISQD